MLRSDRTRRQVTCILPAGVLVFRGLTAPFPFDDDMLGLLQQWQQSLGLIGYSAALAGAGFAIGLIVGLLLRRTPAPLPAPPPPAPQTPEPVEDPSRDKRRNPRRPGRSVEIFVAVAGSFSQPCKGVVLDRAVGGLGILVGDEYAIGSKMSVLPASASKLTPWVEVEVKSCRKSGDDWEIGVQFLTPPPYATMVLFG